MVDGADKIKNDSIQNQYYSISGIDPELVNNNVGNKPLPLINPKPSDIFPYQVSSHDIHFEMPKDAPVEAVEFTDALIKNKAKLVEKLGITPHTYNELAQIAVGIAGKETDFNTNTLYKIRTTIRDAWIKYDRKFLNPSQYAFSMGMTQLKYKLHTKTPRIKNLMEQFDIHEDWDLYDTKKSAIATIIVLAEMNERFDNNEKYKNGLEKSNEKFGTTRREALCKLWNGDPHHEIINGNFNPNNPLSTYSKDVEAYCEKYKLVSEL